MQKGDIKATMKGDRLDSEFKLNYSKNVGKTSVTLESEPSLKKVSLCSS